MAHNFHGAYRRSHAPSSVPLVNAYDPDTVRCEPDGGKHIESHALGLRLGAAVWTVVYAVVSMMQLAHEER